MRNRCIKRKNTRRLATTEENIRKNLLDFSRLNVALEDAVFPHCEVSIFFSLPGRGSCSKQSKYGKDYGKKTANA